MHWVDRGHEPSSLPEVRRRFTPQWVRHYRKGIGQQPKDSEWRQFRNRVEKAFRGLCAYCEEICRGEVEHFRPKSSFPEQVYEWSNWLFACHDCNQAKGAKWPSGGYIDPCTSRRDARPEVYFDFDLVTGEVLPKAELTPSRKRKALRMIDDLRLNEFHHLRKRLLLVESVNLVLQSRLKKGLQDRFILHVSKRESPLSSIIRKALADSGAVKRH